MYRNGELCIIQLKEYIRNTDLLLKVTEVIL